MTASTRSKCWNAVAGERRRPDLIVLDLNLPKRSGSEVLAAVRNDKDLHDTRVVVLTSSDSPADREECESLGITAYLRKPMSLDEFLDLGAEVVRLAAEAAPAQPS